MSSQFPHPLPQHLIPQNQLHGVYVNSEDDLLFLGRDNLLWLANYWESEAKYLHTEVERHQKLIADLDGKTIEDIRQLAKHYDNPDFPEVNRYTKPPEPSDFSSVHRERGTTTFNCCGWCSYFAADTQRFRYGIEGHCQLRPDGFGSGRGYGGEEKFTSMTPCVVTRSSSAQLRLDKRYLNAQRSLMEHQCEQARRYASYAKKLSESAITKPLFCTLRDRYHFMVGSTVVCFLDLDCKDVFSDLCNTFVYGKVMEYDYAVTIQTNRDIRTGIDSGHHRRIAYGKLRPEILLGSEYEYLRDYTEYRELWLCQASTMTKDFYFDEYRAAFEVALIRRKNRS